MKEATEKLLNRFVVLYGSPATTSLLDFYEEYGAVIDPYADDVIKMAGDILIRERDAKSWPTPAACHDACVKAQDIILSRRPVAPKSEASAPPVTPESKARVDQLYREFLANMKSAQKLKITEDLGAASDVSRNAFVNRPGWAPGRTLAQVIHEQQMEKERREDAGLGNGVDHAF